MAWSPILSTFIGDRNTPSPAWAVRLGGWPLSGVMVEPTKETQAWLAAAGLGEGHDRGVLV